MLLNTLLPAVSALPAEWKAQSSDPVFIFKDAACLIQTHSSCLIFSGESVCLLANRTKAKLEGREKKWYTPRQNKSMIF